MLAFIYFVQLKMANVHSTATSYFLPYKMYLLNIGINNPKYTYGESL